MPKKCHKKAMLFLASMGGTGLTHDIDSHLGLSKSLRPKEADFEAEKNLLKNDIAFQLCFPSYGIFPTRNALKLTFAFFQLQLLAPAICYIIPI